MRVITEENIDKMIEELCLSPSQYTRHAQIRAVIPKYVEYPAFDPIDAIAQLREWFSEKDECFEYSELKVVIGKIEEMVKILNGEQERGEEPEDAK